MEGLKLKDLNKKNQNESFNLVSFITEALNKDIKLFKRKFSESKRESFYAELNTLISAGVDIKSALDLIAQEQSNKDDKLLIENIRDNIIKGNPLSTAIHESNMFSNYEYFSIQIGEETGKTTTVLKELSRFYQNRLKHKRQLTSALSYPVLVLLTSFLAIFFMLNFVVPMFADVFKKFGSDLPWITQLILSISYKIKSNFIYGVVLVLIIVIFVSVYKNTLWFKKYYTGAVLRIPFVGELIRKIYLARFCNSMTLLIGSKIPLLRAIHLSCQMIDYYPLEYALNIIEGKIMKGESFYKSLSEFSFFDRRMISLIKVGEEVNQMEVFFEKLSIQYSEDVETQTGLISSLLEPLMIIFLGLVVGVILVAMYLPLFQISNNFQ